MDDSTNAIEAWQQSNPNEPSAIELLEESNSAELNAVNQLNQCDDEYKLGSPVAKDPIQYGQNCILV